MISSREANKSLPTPTDGAVVTSAASLGPTPAPLHATLPRPSPRGTPRLHFLMGATESTARGSKDRKGGGESPTSRGPACGGVTPVGGSPREVVAVAAAVSPRGDTFPDFDADAFNMLCLSPPAGGGGSRDPDSPSAWWKSKIA